MGLFTGISLLSLVEALFWALRILSIMISEIKEKRAQTKTNKTCSEEANMNKTKKDKVKNESQKIATVKKMIT